MPTGESSPDAHLRRRHSTHHESDAENDAPSTPTREDAGVSTGALSPTAPEHSLETPGRVATESLSTSHPIPADSTSPDASGHADNATLPAGSETTPSAVNSSPRVRFSTDVQRPASSAARAPLSIDTETAGGNTRALGASRTPSTRTSPSAYKSLSPTSPGTGTSPISPGARSRGYSLRRTLFNRSIRDGADSGGPGGAEAAGHDQAPIELQDSNSSGSGGDVPKSGSRWHRKGGSVVSVSPILPSFDSSSEGKTTSSFSDDPVAAAKAAYGIGTEGKLTGLSGRRRGDSIVPYLAEEVNKRVARFGLVRGVNDVLERARRIVLRIHDYPPSKDGRHIPLDLTRTGEKLTDERTGASYLGNTIRSSRYNAWNFLPRQLFAQFSKLANL
jgi:phospholipid-translocating ATPase